MGLWSDIATWRGPTANVGGSMREQRGLVVHIAEGTFEGTISWCRNPDSDVSAHFVVAADGRIAQVVNTDVTAWTQRDGNGHWVSVEFEGHTPNPLAAAQLEACARLFVKGHQVYGWPLQLATSPTGRGLGHHSMGAENGANWGHSECPGPAVKAQKPAILARAIAIAGGAGPTPGGLMALLDQPHKAWLYNASNIARAIAGGANDVFVMDPGTGAESKQSLAPFWARLGGNPLTEEQLAVLTATVAAAAETGAEHALDDATVTTTIDTDPGDA